MKARSRPLAIGPLILCRLILSLLSLTTVSAAVPITCWDAASEFNDSNNADTANPSGVWSYGWKEMLTGKFYLALTHFDDPPNRFGWCSGSGYPILSHVTFLIPTRMHGPNSVTLAGHALNMHPGPNGEYAVLRFTAPATGMYRVSGQFYAEDDNSTGTTTDVWILPNDSKTGAFSGSLDYKQGAMVASFMSRSYQLKKGDALDFEVGYGANKNMEYDSTGLVAIIERTQ